MKKWKDRLMHNLGIKIMALLFSFVLWMVAGDINDPVTNKYINNVPVQLVNTGTLTARNKTYKVINDTGVVRVTVRAPETVLDDIDSQSITARADFTQITEDNKVPIEVGLSSSADVNVERISANREYLELSVENEKTRQLSIEVLQNGTLPDGYVTGRITTETNTMNISGPESAVDSVARAVVDVSLDNVRSNVEIDATIRLLDEEGNEISDSDIKKSIESVRVTVPILEAKEVPVRAEASGTPADGYALNGTVTVEPSTVRIAGRASVLDSIHSIEIPAEVLDVTDAEENVTVTVDLKDYLPAEAALADGSGSGTVTVTAEVEPLRRKTLNIDADSVQLLNIPDGWLAEALPGQSLQLTVSGLQENLNQVDASTVTPHVNLSDLAGADGTMPEGETDATVRFLLPSSVDQVNTVSVRIRLTKTAAADAAALSDTDTSQSQADVAQN